MSEISTHTSKLEAVHSAIDQINNQDKNITHFEGVDHPKELLYGHLMSNCLKAHWPDATESLQIAVRAQHIKRWHLKRSDYKQGKAGYYQWRIALGKYHAELTSSLMLEAGYTSEEANRTGAIIRKEKIKLDEETQTLEDVACLVFLQYYFSAFADKYTGSDEAEQKIINIVRKTWAKMSDKAHDIALKLPLPEHLGVIVKKALSD
ncbi:MAG: DUF4202 domain-containing protein [Colwellia sp.]